MSAEVEIKRRNRLEVSKRRAAEERDAIHFLLAGHDAHLAKGCIHDDPCSRDYETDPPDPRVEAVACTGITAPTPESDYVGTGIGFLYGLGGDEHAWQMAGWNVRRAA